MPRHEEQFASRSHAFDKCRKAADLGDIHRSVEQASRAATHRTGYREVMGTPRGTRARQRFGTNATASGGTS